MKTFDEQVRETMAEWQKRFEEMQQQFLQGKANAAEHFEMYKEHLKQSVTKLRGELDNVTDSAETHVKELRAKLEQLYAQLNLGKAATIEAFKEQRERIEAVLHEVYLTGKSASHKHYEQLMQLFDNSASAFKTGLEILQLQFALAKMDSREESERIRKSIDEKMQEVTVWMKELKEQGTKNAEEWGKMARDYVEKMQDWTTDFMKGFSKH